MTPQLTVVKGPDYLPLATTLLQRIRLAAATGGIWEAADVQWWSRHPRQTDREGQLFWLTEDGTPAAAVLRTDFEPIQCDVLAGPGGEDAPVWAEALARAQAGTEFPVRDDDAAGLAALTQAGYRPDGSAGVVASWLAAAGRPAVPPLPPGYRLLSRAEVPGRPHPMVARNGPEVAGRLLGCSLYRPELDLLVEAPDGRVAGYGLFWADPVTRVGLVEPMRTEDAFQQRGIASHLLAAGLERLAQCGCQRFKVSNDIPLYLRAGFTPLPSAAAAVYARPAALLV